MQGSVCVHLWCWIKACRRVHICVCVQLRARIMDMSSSAHLCCATCAYDHFLVLSWWMVGGEQREGRGKKLAVTPVPRTSSGPMQHQATATKAYNWVSTISWPSRWTQCHLSLLGNLAWVAQFTCIIRTTLREVITEKIVCTIIEFLQQVTTVQ